MDNISQFFFVLTNAIIYVLIHQIISRFYLLEYSLFFKYSCTNIFHRRSRYTLYAIPLPHLNDWFIFGNNAVQIWFIGAVFNVIDALLAVCITPVSRKMGFRFNYSLKVPDCQTSSSQSILSNRCRRPVHLVYFLSICLKSKVRVVVMRIKGNSLTKHMLKYENYVWLTFFNNGIK